MHNDGLATSSVECHILSPPAGASWTRLAIGGCDSSSRDTWVSRSKSRNKSEERKQEKARRSKGMENGAGGSSKKQGGNEGVGRSRRLQKEAGGKRREPMACNALCQQPRPCPDG